MSNIAHLFERQSYHNLSHDQQKASNITIFCDRHFHHILCYDKQWVSYIAHCSERLFQKSLGCEWSSHFSTRLLSSCLVVWPTVCEWYDIILCQMPASSHILPYYLQLVSNIANFFERAVSSQSHAMPWKESEALLSLLSYTIVSKSKCQQNVRNCVLFAWLIYLFLILQRL